MKHRITHFFLAVVLVMSIAPSLHAQSPTAYLEKAYPKLTELFRDELNRYTAHYIFAIDVSGSMKKNSPAVTSSLISFFKALPDGDRVDVIPFGNEAMLNMMDYSGVINPQVRQTLCNNIGGFYTNSSYSREMIMTTNVGRAVDAVAKNMANNRDYKVNVVIIITDFLNCEQLHNARKLTPETVSRIHDAIAAASNGIYTRFVALGLPFSPTNEDAPGYCLGQLKDEVFNLEDSYLEVVSMQNPSDQIGQWFEQLKRDIMVTKLRAVIDNANRVNPATLKVKTTIDGNVDARVSWRPSKLYPEIKIDSSYLLGDDFKFINYTKNFTRTTDTLIEVELGKIKHRSMGLHQLQDTLNLGLTLPTEYDNELTSLGVKKPLPNTRSEIKRLIFTFPLSFWFTCTLIILIILYIIGVINAIARNGKLSFSGKVTFYDDMGNQIDSPVNITRQTSTLVFGAGGSPRLSVEDAAWQFTLSKRNGNPFVVFAKPYFLWERKRGSVLSGRAASGKLSPWGSKTATLACGPTRNERSHSVKIQLLNR